MEKDGALIFKVLVVTRASRSEITGAHDSALRVRIAAPPVDGAANTELIRVLAKAFKVSKSAVKITSGLASKHKEVSVNGASVQDLNRLLRQSKTN